MGVGPSVAGSPADRAISLVRVGLPLESSAPGLAASLRRIFYHFAIAFANFSPFLLLPESH